MVKKSNRKDTYTSVICSYCCKLIKVPESWKQGNTSNKGEDTVQLVYDICPDCMKETHHHGYPATQVSIRNSS